MSGIGENSGEHLAEDSSLDFPEPPEKPLDSDCCGTGCVPCVFDIYDEEMAKWRLECDRIKSGKSILEDLPDGSFEQVLSTSEFRCFDLESITQMTDDSCIYRFKIPGNRKLGIKVGQHLNYEVRCKHDRDNSIGISIRDVLAQLGDGGF